MHQKPLYPLLALLCGGVGLLLRVWQNVVGFEPGTGLVLYGAPPLWLLPGALALLTAGLLLAVRWLPREAAGAFTAEDSGSTTAGALVTAGILLSAGSGVMGLLAGMARQSRLDMVLGAMTVVCMAALLPAAAACKRGGSVPGGVMLVPVAYCVVRLILTYRESSVDPALAAYYLEILALAALVMGFYRLSAFGYGCGATRAFAYWAVLAVTLSITALADFLPFGNRSLDPVSLAFFGGCALLLLGLLLDRLRNRGPNAPPPLHQGGRRLML